MNTEANTPLVSVIMSTYNRADNFLPRAIKSCLEQTYKNWELIIVGDGCTDTTEEVVKAFQKDEPRIIFKNLDKNTGTDAKPKNTAILMSTGEYICYLDDDCEFMPYHIEKLLKKIQSSDVDIVYGDMWILDEENPKWEGQLGLSMDFNGQFLLRRNYIDFSMAIHKRDAVFKVGGIDESLPRFKDWNMFVRMMKAGCSFLHLPMIVTNYYVHNNNSAVAHPVESWVDEQTKMTFFKPTFDPAGCYIYLPYLGDDRWEEKDPRVAIFTITYDRLDYTKRMHESMCSGTDYPFDWFVFDNGSKDGTEDWLNAEPEHLELVHLNGENVGITKASNELLDMTARYYPGYQILIKVDNDCEFMTKGWLNSIVDLWKRNHKLYMSPYVEGLVHNPGGAPRIGHSFIGPYFVEVTMHVGGICAAIDAHAYKEWRWNDKFLHGNQDREASDEFRRQGYMPMYLPLHRIKHMDTTEGQQKKFPEYFERRKKEKTTHYKDPNATEELNDMTSKAEPEAKAEGLSKNIMMPE